MWAMPVVLMEPGVELELALGGVLIKGGIGPFAKGGLEETFGFAIGAWGVGTGAVMANAETAASGGEEAGVVARGIVGENATDANAETGVISDGGIEESDGRVGALVGIETAEGDAGVIINGYMQHLPAGAASFIARISGEAMARLDDAGELFGI